MSFESSQSPDAGYSSPGSGDFTSSEVVTILEDVKVESMSSFDTCGFSPESSTSSESFSISLPPPIRQKCTICPRPAYCTNYGAITCDACKMFFRRIVVLKRTYKCKRKMQCWPTTNFRCKACRYQQCLDVGMTYLPTFMEMISDKDDRMAKMISGLMDRDQRRCERMRSWFTDEDLSLEEVIEKKGMRLEPRKSDLSTHDWSFLGIYTSIEFLMGIETFDGELGVLDTMLLLKNFAVKASLFSSAMRAVREKRDRLMTVDGRDVYPDGLVKLGKFPDGFLHRIRSLLVSRLLDLHVTNEEFVLITAIFFFNDSGPGLESLSPIAKETISKTKSAYASALFQYCLYTYQQSGPSRFADLLSLCHVINRNFDDVQYLTIIFKFYQRDVEYRKIVLETV